MEQISLKDLKKYFPDASPATLQRNSGLGELENSQRKPDPAQALDGSPQVFKKRKRTVASRLTVHIITFRQRLLDSDNFEAGAKPLRDAIAKSLGVDDSDKFVNWNYHQIIAKPYGTLVLLSDE